MHGHVDDRSLNYLTGENDVRQRLRSASISSIASPALGWVDFGFSYAAWTPGFYR